jgi:hypothetical protein
VSDVLRFPLLLFALGVEQLRRLPGARSVAPWTRWIARLLLLAALVLTLFWAAESSPQRLSLADLAAGKLGSMQSWIIVTGDLADEPGSSDELHLYRLTDPDAPNAYLIVQSQSVQTLGRTTVSGRIEGGGVYGVPAGYAWSAWLTADASLAGEQPPPWAAIVLGGTALLIMAARRTSYPMFVGEAPGETVPAMSALRVTVRGRSGALDRRAVPATMAFTGGEPGSADLSIGGGPPVSVQLHSAFTGVDVGRLLSLSRTEPALRFRPEGHDLVVVFSSRRERDSALAALGAEAQRSAARQPTRVVG